MRSPARARSRPGVAAPGRAAQSLTGAAILDHNIAGGMPCPPAIRCVAPRAHRGGRVHARSRGRRCSRTRRRSGRIGLPRTAGAERHNRWPAAEPKAARAGWCWRPRIGRLVGGNGGCRDVDGRRDRLGAGSRLIGRLQRGSARPRRRLRWRRLLIGAGHAGGDDRDANPVAQALVEGGADDDVGVGIDLLAHAARRLVDLLERQVAAAGDRQQQALGAAAAKRRPAAGWRWPPRRHRWRAARRTLRPCPSWRCPCRSARSSRRRSRG